MRQQRLIKSIILAFIFIYVKIKLIEYLAKNFINASQFQRGEGRWSRKTQDQNI